MVAFIHTWLVCSRQTMALWLSLPAVLLLGACASSNSPPVSSSSYLHDELFAAAPYPISAREVMAFSPAMQAYLDTDIEPPARIKGKRQALMDALYTKHQLQLDYDSGMTRNAAQAFEARSGNCLSLLLMTAAFAKRLDLPVTYQRVEVAEQWSRSGGLYFLLGHVNLTLGHNRGNGVSLQYDADLLTIDFVPPELTRGLRTRVIDESTVLAMYMNNRAAETLNLGLLDEAYGWARAAVLEDPRYLAAYNTLAVIYRRHGHPEHARTVLRYVLSEEARNPQAMSNLVLVLNELGHMAEAAALEAQLKAVRSYQPYQLFDRGVAAMNAGDFAGAKRLFAEEIEHAAYVPEFHFWLGLANYAQGELRQAHRHLQLARDYSNTRLERDLYSAKLEKLKDSANRELLR
jgi:Tfp pilus assembly protein PilF